MDHKSSSKTYLYRGMLIGGAILEEYTSLQKSWLTIVLPLYDAGMFHSNPAKHEATLLLMHNGI